jgi:hypothetical protein
MVYKGGNFVRGTMQTFEAFPLSTITAQHHITMSEAPLNPPPRTYGGFESAYFDTLVIPVPVFDGKGYKTGKRIPLSLPVYKAITLQGEPDDNTPFVPLGISYGNIWMEASTVKHYLDPVLRKGDYHSVKNKFKKLPFNTWDQHGVPLKSLRSTLFFQPGVLSEDKWDTEQEKLWYNLLKDLQRAVPEIPDDVSAHVIQPKDAHKIFAGNATTVPVTKCSEDSKDATHHGFWSTVNTQSILVSRLPKDEKKGYKKAPDSSIKEQPRKYWDLK